MKCAACGCVHPPPEFTASMDVASLRAVKVRKARREGWCPACNGPVRVGQQIGYWPAFPGWQHVQCGLALVREAKGAA